MPAKNLRLTLPLAAVAMALLTAADEDPRVHRQDIMGGVREAAKPVGQMLRGNADFDTEVLNETLQTFLAASEEFGGLFPPGTESGEETEAAPAIWENRAGFDENLSNWNLAIAAAIDANPQSLEEARPVVGPVFNACKNCHDDYRIERD